MLASFSTETVVGWKMTLHAHLLAHMYMSLEMRWKKHLSIVFTSVKGWADRINAWHSFVDLFCQALASNTPFYLISVPTTRCQSVKQGSVLSYNSALSREGGAPSRSSFGQFSLGLGHKPWKSAVFFGLTGPESTFFSDTVSLISAEE